MMANGNPYDPSTETRRVLSDQFMTDLLTGKLHWLLRRVQEDTTLSLDIRSDRVINVYYRGASLMQVTQSSAQYRTQTSHGYFPDRRPPIKLPTNAQDEALWEQAIPIIKDAIDRYLSARPGGEREYQQLVQVENTRQPGLSSSTDYFICDTEYTGLGFRFDMIGAYWPSSGSIRKDPNDLPIVLIEMKYGDRAMTGSASIQKHVEDFARFFEEPDRASQLAAEMTLMFNQKIMLGLVPASIKKVSITHERCQAGLLIANHDPESKNLLCELGRLDEELLGRIPNGLKVFSPSGGGYGLFHNQVYDIKEYHDNIRKGLNRNLELNKTFKH